MSKFVFMSLCVWLLGGVSPVFAEEAGGGETPVVQEVVAESDGWGKATTEIKEAAHAVSEATVDTSKKVWEVTKKESKEAWEATKDGSSRAWEVTKEEAGEAWEKGLEKSMEVWEEGKEKLHEATKPEAAAPAAEEKSGVESVPESE